MFNWYARYLKLKNSDGEEIIIDRLDKSRKYKRMAKAFVNFTQFEGLIYYKHLTLTQEVEFYKPNILNAFFVKLRRFYGNIAYIWTTEVQEERKEKYGESVLHWHVVAFEGDVRFEKEDIERIQLYWKYGNVDIKPVRKLNLNYLMKYITKALDTPLIEYHGLKIHK